MWCKNKVTARTEFYHHLQSAVANPNSNVLISVTEQQRSRTDCQKLLRSLQRKEGPAFCCFPAFRLCSTGRCEHSKWELVFHILQLVICLNKVDVPQHLLFHIAVPVKKEAAESYSATITLCLSKIKPADLKKL